MSLKPGDRLVAFTAVEREGRKTFWLRVGIGSVNADSSVNITLAAFPANGKLHIRLALPKQEGRYTGPDFPDNGDEPPFDEGDR